MFAFFRFVSLRDSCPSVLVDVQKGEGDTLSEDGNFDNHKQNFEDEVRKVTSRVIYLVNVFYKRSLIPFSEVKPKGWKWRILF